MYISSKINNKVFLYIIVFSFIIGLFKVSSYSTTTLYNSHIDIQNITVDALTNKIILKISKENEVKNQLDTLPDLLRYQVSFKPYSLSNYQDLPVVDLKDEENTAWLTVFLPLQYALVSGETFSFKIKMNDMETQRKVQMGSYLHPFNLKSYSNDSTTAFIVVSTILTLLIILGICFIIPLLQKIKFKSKYVQKYKEQDPITDPFTYVPIKYGDQIVKKEDTLVLLNSWKRIFNFDEKIKERYTDFYFEYPKENFINLSSYTSKSFMKAALGILGLYLGYTIAIFLIPETNSNQILLANYNPANPESAPPIFYKDLLSAGLLAIFYTLSQLCFQLFFQKRDHTLAAYFIGFIKNFGLLLVCFLIAPVILTFVLGHSYLSNGLFWLSFAIGINFMVFYRQQLLRTLLQSVIVGLICFTGYIISFSIFSNYHANPRMATFIAFILLALSPVYFSISVKNSGWFLKNVRNEK